MAFGYLALSKGLKLASGINFVAARCTVLKRCVPQKSTPCLCRQITTTSPNFLKEVRETATGNSIVIEGVYVESPRSSSLIQLGPGQEDTRCCSLCRLNLDLQHTDVLILSQFVRSNGLVLPRRITGLCGYQQKLVASLVAQAQKAGLMMNLTTSIKKDPKRRYQHKSFNRYFVPEAGGVKTKRYK